MRLQKHEELVVELYPDSWTNTNRIRVFYIDADDYPTEPDVESGWYHQFAADSGDIGSDPIGPFKSAKQAYQDARNMDDDECLPSWRTIKNRGWA